MIEWPATERADTVRLAAPPEAFTDPSKFEPSANVIVPLGTPTLEVMVAVNVTGWLKTEGFAEDTTAMEVVATAPVPLRDTVCGLSVEESEIVTDALRKPVALGANATTMLQAPPEERVAPQVVDSVNSLEFVPTSEMELIFNVPLPVLLRTMVWGVLVVPTV